MRTLKSTLERAYKTIYTTKLKDCPDHLVYSFIYEFTVCAGLNIIDMYTYILDTQDVPQVTRDKLLYTRDSLKVFYNE